MENVITRIEVDLYSPTSYEVIKAQQGDSLSRIVEIALLNKGEPYVIPTHNVSIRLEGHRGDGSSFSKGSNCTLKDNIITVVLDNDILFYSGTVEAKVVLYELPDDGTKRILSSIPFRAHVQKNPCDKNNVTMGNKSLIDDLIFDFTNLEVAVNKTITDEIDRATKAEKDLDAKKVDKTTIATSSTLGLVKSGTDIIVDSSGNVSVKDNSHKHTASNISDLTATASELNVLDGITSTTTELNKLHGTTATVDDFNKLHDVTASASELNIMDGVTATTTELNYVDGVTSNIQTQLNSKQPNITGGATTITSSNLTASRALISNSSGKVAVSDVTSTELGYLDGVTSNIQTQLDAKAPLASPTLTGTPKAPTASAGTNSTQIATTAFVTTAVANGIAASDAMIIKGTIGTSGTVTSLPTTYKTGWTYRVVTAGTYAGQVCEIGDLIVALVDRSGSGNVDSDWCVAQTNINGAITGIKSGDAYISTSQSGSVVTITHKDVTRTNTTSTASPSHGGTFTAVKTVTSDAKGHVTGVDTETVTLPSAYTHPSYTARTGVPTANQTPAFGGTFSVSQPVSDATGHITAMNSRTITIPSAVATTSSAGLESAADKTKLDGIATGAEVNQNAFSNVVVGSTTISADSKTDSLTLAGSNVTLTPDATNDKVTIGITKANVTSALGYTPPTTNTTYGVATSSTLGLVKSGTDITVDSSGNVSVNDDSHNHVISNVDGLQTALDGKAVKKELTSENLNDIKTPGFYNAGGSNSVTNKPSGVDHFGLYVVKRASGDYYTQILIDNNKKQYRRHCENGTWGSWAEDKLTDTNTTYSAATTSASGLMTAAMVTKLNGIATGANAYSHPTSSGNKHIPSGGSSGQILRWSADGTAVWGADNNTTYSDMKGATSSAAGTHGLVPAPASGKQSSFLRGDGTWAVPTDTNTHYASGTIVNNSTTATSNTSSALTNGNVYLNHIENGAVKNSHKISGSGATTVTTDSSGNIIISSTDTNTTYSKLSQFTNDSGYITGITKAMVTTALGYTPPTTNTTYSKATSSTLGLVKIGYTASGKNYPVALNDSGQMYVNVPWTDNNTTYSNFVKSGSGAKAGLVPAPSTTAGTTKYLREDGTWAVPPDTNTTYTSLKNPYALTIQGNGTTLTNGTYDGSAAKTVNITPSSIGAAASSHGTHVTYSTTKPVMDGTASVGTATTVARSDHKHPTDTSRASTSSVLSTVAQCEASTTSTDIAGASALAELNNSLIPSSKATITGNYGKIYYCKCGNVCTVSTDQQSGTFNSWTTYVLGTLPTGYRPIIEVYTGDTRIGNRARADGIFNIRTDGTISITFAQKQTILEQITITFVCS